MLRSAATPKAEPAERRKLIKHTNKEELKPSIRKAKRNMSSKRCHSRTDEVYKPRLFWDSVGLVFLMVSKDFQTILPNSFSDALLVAVHTMREFA